MPSCYAKISFLLGWGTKYPKGSGRLKVPSARLKVFTARMSHVTSIEQDNYDASYFRSKGLVMS
jgi:hypothetical protein